MTDKHNKQQNVCTSSERTQNKCPYCGTSDMLPASPIFASPIFDVDFACGTRMHINKTHCVQGLECVIRQQARSELSKDVADYLQSSIEAFGEERTEITNHKDAYDWLRDDVENLIEDLTK